MNTFIDRAERQIDIVCPQSLYIKDEIEFSALENDLEHIFKTRIVRFMQRQYANLVTSRFIDIINYDRRKFHHQFEEVKRYINDVFANLPPLEHFDMNSIINEDLNVMKFRR